ncbi:MAG: 30S ribosomal protein S16 [Candidatus Nealsonbacteria bacterium]|nr:30S ribosomal protein S16 [Candidatus Nealsonbacteria bacterium]
MLVIRFIRVGKKNQPSFKMVITDKRRSSKSSRFVEEVGFYNPLTKKRVLKKERIQYWISKGVKPSPTIYNLLVKDGVLEGKKIAVHKKSKSAQGGSASGGKPVEAVAPAAPVAPSVPAAETPKPEESPK